MSMMEDKFDKSALTASSYIVTLPQAAKEMILEEGELYVPGENDQEVRLEIFDADANGNRIEKPSADTAEASGPSYPKKGRDRRAQRSSAEWSGSSSVDSTKQGHGSTRWTLSRYQSTQR